MENEDTPVPPFTTREYATLEISEGSPSHHLSYAANLDLFKWHFTDLKDVDMSSAGGLDRQPFLGSKMWSYETVNLRQNRIKLGRNGFVLETRHN